jgi:AcrR family transcriptional regulator
MVIVVAEQGYENATVADLLEITGMSRNTFYKHFSNKQECFLATLDAVSERVGRRLLDTYREHEGPWDERLRAELDTAIDMIVRQPAAAKLFLVDAHAAGEEATERVERVGRALERLTVHAMRESSDSHALPLELTRALLGGVQLIIHARVRGGRTDELKSLAPELAAWALGYTAPVEPLAQPSTPPRPQVTGPPPGAEARERILWAMAEILDRKGYPAMTIGDIAQEAGVSFTTFYSHFEGKQEALIAGLEFGEQRLLADTVPVYQAQPNWAHAVADGVQAFFAHLSANPKIARLGGFDAYSGGDTVRAWRERSIFGFQAFLEPGFQEHPGTRRIVSEGVGAAIASMFYAELRDRRAERLYEIAPIATFIALAPFVGNRAACELANRTPG